MYNSIASVALKKQRERNYHSSAHEEARVNFHFVETFDLKQAKIARLCSKEPKKTPSTHTLEEIIYFLTAPLATVDFAQE